MVEGRTDGYRLAVEPDAVDAVRFERLITAGRARTDDATRRVRLLREALELWRGAAMQDVGLQDSAAFDAAVARLEESHLAAVEERVASEIALGRGAEMVTELTDLVAAHPLRERLVAALLRALAAAGRGSEALLAYQRTREALADRLGADPSPELAALHVALLRGELGPREETRKTNLRAELTAFVGKGADVAAVRGLIAEHRLTTVIGPAGSGKSRLAAETARTLLGDLPDGAWLVELATIRANGYVADVAQSTLAGMGLRDALLGGTPNATVTDRLITAVRERDALLILDNCEHVIESAAVFAHRVLGECRRLRILATSREPLGITGEALWPLQPLALPEQDADLGEIESSPAVQLLRDRAGAVRRDLAADAHTLATMARVCRALDGMPLAIELAAARLRTLSVAQLASRLDDRFRLLTSGSRTALPRHKTLRAAVDWSWELLTSLTEKSLLLAEGDDDPRYRMIGTIKEYARHRLAETGDTNRARRAHLEYFTELAATADPLLRRAEPAMRLAAGAGWYWWLGGHKTEGFELLTEASRMPGEATDEVRAIVYALIAMFVSSGRSGDEREAARWLHKTVQFSRRGQRRHPVLRFSTPLERVLLTPDAFLPAFEPLLDDEDPWVRAMARLHMGKMQVMLGRDGRDVDAYLDRALTEFRALGERFGISFALTELADRITVRGEFAGACEYYEQAVAVVTEVGAAEDLVRMRSRQAQLDWLLGDASAGAAAIAEASGTRSGSPGLTRWPSWLLRRRNSPGGTATPRKRAGSSVSQRPHWAEKRSGRTSAR